MVYFTKEQIDFIVDSYKKGKTLREIGEFFNVSRPTIQKILKGNYPEYTGKKRASMALENQTKTCSKCKRDLPLEKFNRGNSLYGRRSFCRECEKAIQNTPEKRLQRRKLEKTRRENPKYVLHRNKMDRERRHNNPLSIKLALLNSAKRRAKIKGLDFNIGVSDIELPEKCPLLGIELTSNYREKTKYIDNSYSIDRIDSNKGYVKGNVWIISYRANAIKNNASLEELELLVKNLRNKLDTLKTFI